MSEPLIRGKAGPAGEDYLLSFYDWATGWNPYMLYYASVADGGSALAELQELFDNVFMYIENGRGYALGSAIGWRNESNELVPAAGGFQEGVEVVLRYASPPGRFTVDLSIKLNGDHHFEILYGEFDAGADGVLEVRILCQQKLLKVVVAGVTMVELDPSTIEWGWAGRPAYYWLYLYAGAPYLDAVAQGTPHSKNPPWVYFRGADIAHIREIEYYAASGGPPLFFTDFVRSYERR